MQRNEMQAVADQYERAFGVPVPPVPLDYGQPNFDLDWFYSHAKAAIEAGKPLDWAAILPPLPDGAVS